MQVEQKLNLISHQAREVKEFQLEQGPMNKDILKQLEESKKENLKLHKMIEERDILWK